MSRLVIDAQLPEQLKKTFDQVELYTPDGRLIGHFIPSISLVSHPELAPSISEEELDRREKAGGGRPLAEILADLEKRK